VALAAGEAPAARSAAGRAKNLLGETAQTLLLDAEANRLAGREAEAEAIYRRMAERPDAAFLGLRGLFRQAMAREDWAEAARLAKRAEAAHPGGAWLQDERLQLAVRSGDWSLAARISGAAAPRIAYATAAVESTADPAQAEALAKKAWRQDPGFAPAALAYATRLRAAGREKRAQSVLAEAWNAGQNPALADFALAPLTDPLARIAAANRLVGKTRETAESQFLLARLSLAAGLTGEARRHAMAARAAGMRQKRFFLLLADLEAAEHGESEAGQRAQRDALRQAAEAEPDPAWHCDSCGAAHGEWHPVCPACQTPGRLRWGARARLAPVAV
jgi:HemY protein